MIFKISEGTHILNKYKCKVSRDVTKSVMTIEMNYCNFQVRHPRCVTS
jgi:hypothetical protein